MKRFSQIFLSITVIILLAWQVPAISSFFARPERIPFTLYSCVLEDFIKIGTDENGLIRQDMSGANYTLDETDSLLPFFYYRQLTADGRFPDTIKGIPVTPRDVQLTNFIFRAIPTDYNVNSISLYPLLESMSGRVNLEMSEDVFRFTEEGIVFIVMNTNTVNEEKSKRFTKALNDKGFVFPAKRVAGNPTTNKEYDEGYLILDNEGKLFHMKMTVGRPYVRAIDLPKEMVANYLFITEFNDKKTLGYISDIDNKLWVIDRTSYEISKIEIPSYNPETDEIAIYGNMLDWNINITTLEAEEYYAVNANDYTLIKSARFPYTKGSVHGLFFTSSIDEFVKPRLY